MGYQAAVLENPRGGGGGGGWGDGSNSYSLGPQDRGCEMHQTSRGIEFSNTAAWQGLNQLMAIIA